MHSHEHQHSTESATDKPRVGYCVKCKASRAMRDPKQIERGGGPAIEGRCVECESQIFIMGGELSPGA
jgi:hypothetical protein